MTVWAAVLVTKSPAVPESVSIAAMVATAVGAVVSSRKLVVLAGAACGLPAASVCVALTLIVPSVRDAASPDVRTTGCELPVPVTVLMTVWAPLVNVTVMVAPSSPVTVTTPPAAVASASEAPSAIPVPSAMVTPAGAVLSRT